MRRSVLAPKQITGFHLVFAAHQFVGSNAFFANLAVFIQHQLQHFRSLLFARAGIQREVYMNAQSATHVRDYEEATDLDGEYKYADFHLFVELGKAGEGKIKGAEVEVSLLDKAGKSIYNERKRWNAADRELHFKKEVREPLLWSAEKPNLYRLLIALRVNGKPEQYISQYIGFRKSEF